jgi:hypothetical protein
MIDEARALANSDNPAERLRGQEALQQLKNQGYNVS